MMNIFLFPFRLALRACKVTALILALVLMIVLLVPGVTGLNSRECETCLQWQEQYTALERDYQELLEALNAQYSMLRRIDLQFFGQEWLTLRCFSFWGDVGYRHYEAFPEGTSEVIWTSSLLECSLTTLERSCAAE